MKLELSKKMDNPLLSRTKMLFEIKHDEREATPSRKQVKDVLGAKLGANKELLVIKSIKSLMGVNSSSGVAYLYKDKKAFDRLASEYLKKRDIKELKAKKEEAEVKEEKQAEEEKGQAPKEEKPAESKLEVKEGIKKEKKEGEGK